MYPNKTVAEERDREVLPGNVGDKTNSGGEESRGVSDTAKYSIFFYLLFCVLRVP